MLVKRELKKACRSEKNPQQGPATFLTDTGRWNSAIGELWIRRSHPPAIMRRPEQEDDRNYETDSISGEPCGKRAN